MDRLVQNEAESESRKMAGAAVNSKSITNVLFSFEYKVENGGKTN